MIKSRTSLVVAMIVLVLSIYAPLQAFASNPLDKQGIKQLLDKADEAQYSLSEKYYTWDEALHTLTPYMTSDWATAFMKQHLFLEEKGYIYYGTDFSIYLVPRFSYDEKTNVVLNQDKTKMFIYEKSSGTGPVIYENQYDVVTLVNDDGNWKIAEVAFLEDLPNEIKEGTIVENRTSTLGESKSMESEPNMLSFGPSKYYSLVFAVPYFSIMKHSDYLFAAEYANNQFLTSINQ